MVSTLQFLIDLFVLLAAAVGAGELAAHFGQPPLAGQLLVGVLMGPTLIGPYIGLRSFPSELVGLQVLATVFVLFLAGLELSPEQIFRMPPRDMAMGVAVFTIPFLAAILGAFELLPGLAFTTVLFVALTLSITALPVMGIMLSEFDLTGKPLGRMLMNAAVINEFAAVTIFAVLLHTGSGSGWTGVGEALGTVALFLGLMIGIHFLLQFLRARRKWAPIVRWFRDTWLSKQGGFALLMVLLLASTLLSEAIGLTYVLGAFYAGLLVTRQSVGRDAHESFSEIFSVISWGFFVPLFFVFVGVQMNLTLLSALPAIGLFLALLAIASGSKIGIGYLAARVDRWRESDALATGFLLNSRGGVQLAMAVILLESNLIGETLFTIIAGIGLVTSIIAPIGAVWAWRWGTRSRANSVRAPHS